MSNTKIIPLFSKSFAGLLRQLIKDDNDKIARYLIEVNTIMEGFCEWFPHNIENWTISADDTENLSYISKVEYLKLWEEMNQLRISEYINDSVRMIDFRYDIFEVSFLPKGKEPIYTSDNRWARSNRQTGKPTRILKRLINCKLFTDHDYETFNNRLRSHIEADNGFEIVTGDEIREWYYYENYYEDHGTLGNSCMKHSECQSYFEVYEKFASMLILKKENKILGRAILWHQDGNTFMDRVYTTRDHYLNNFINYAHDNKFYYRESQSMMSSGDYVRWYGPNDNYEEPQELYITIKLQDVPSYFPYMDTLRYWYQKDNIISSNPDLKSGYHAVTLDSTEGWFDEDMVEYYCPYCGHVESCHEGNDPHDFIWSGWHEEYICDECSIYSRILDDYILEEKSIILHNGDIFIDDKHAQDEYNIIMINNEYYSTEDDNIIEINGEYYLPDDERIYYDKEQEEYKLKDE